MSAQEVRRPFAVSAFADTRQRTGWCGIETCASEHRCWCSGAPYLNRCNWQSSACNRPAKAMGSATSANQAVAGVPINFPPCQWPVQHSSGAWELPAKSFCTHQQLLHCAPSNHPTEATPAASWENQTAAPMLGRYVPQTERSISDGALNTQQPEGYRRRSSRQASRRRGATR